MVEGTPLLREHLAKPWIGSSNLLVSANVLYKSITYINLIIYVPSTVPKIRLYVKTLVSFRVLFLLRLGISMFPCIALSLLELSCYRLMFD